MINLTEGQARKVDALVTEHVMGWTWRNAVIRFPRSLPGEVGVSGWYVGDELMAKSMQPTSYDADMCKVLDGLASANRNVKLTISTHGVTLQVMGDIEAIGFKNRRHAVCVGALRAVGVDDKEWM